MMPQVFSPSLGKKHLAVFPLAGFCIDYTRFKITTGKNITHGPTAVERYSFSAQVGCGATLPVSKRLNFSLETHYMLHVGTDVDIDIEGDNERLFKVKGTNIEGHFVFALSMDYKLISLWGRKRSSSL